MYKLQHKYAIGCLVQWYEIELIEEYIESLKQALNYIGNRENVLVDFTLTTNQKLEKIDLELIEMNDIVERFETMMVDTNFEWRVTDKLVTIADYRRDFNENYCEEVDMLMWGETDALIPKQNFEILDMLHTNNIKQNLYKYIAFYGTCKMWDDTWKILEHPEFTDKPFIDGDTENWWSLRYNMTLDEMNEINDRIEDLDIRVANPYKFNGCGLVISSDIVKCGANIPRSVFFVHEDTAFMNSLIRNFNGAIPQFVIKNVLLVHNRKHPKKRSYIFGETDIEPGDVGSARKTHDWYDKANKMCEHNAYNAFNQSKTYTWEDVFDDTVI